jgi:hypothetical protein
MRPLPSREPMKSNFFTKHLKERGWKIHGMEDIENFKPRQARLLECMKGLEDGTMYFEDVGMPLQ